MTAMQTPFFELSNAKVWRGDILALHNLSISLHTGENGAILGPNGAGKSSLLKLITGEVRPEANPLSTCKLFGEERWCLEEIRHHIGLVMPEEINRFDDLELASDVVLTAFRGAYGRTRDMRFHTFEKNLAAAAIDEMGISSLAERPFGQLSSGEKRRFLIARALVHQPEILVLDEPSTALDFAARLHLLERLRSITKTTTSIVLVTHDPGEIFPEIQRVILLKDGRILADGVKQNILNGSNLSELYDMPLSLKWQNNWPIVRPA
jgi:iron complex transport system ATP-binding protein